MRIRELYFNNFRAFRGERTISFVDPLSDTVRPVTVLAGSNGSGKTTILNAIEALLNFMLYPTQTSDFMREAWNTGLVRLTLETTHKELNPGSSSPETDEPILINIAVGQSNLAPAKPTEAWKNLFCHLVPRGGGGNHYKRLKPPFVEQFRKTIRDMMEGWQELQGGLLYFPYERQIPPMKGGPIEMPPDERQWIFRLSHSDSWKGSLEQLWVWQNYRDLEENDAKRTKLAPFVSQVEEVLGAGRSITIKEGRALATVGWAVGQDDPPKVNLSQLPSGEQNVLLLFGELARRRRPGAVIVVDEIEDSLHPTLQRLAMWNLRRLAREWNAQVIVTTHSIEVINTVRGGAFINLDYPEQQSDYPRSLAENDEVES